MKSLLASLFACLLVSCSTQSPAPPTGRAKPATIATVPMIPLPSNQTVQRHSSIIVGTAAVAPKSYRLEWDYTGPGPVWFEVWRANDLGPFSWVGGTNVPVGWTLFATTPKTNAYTVSVPITISNVSGFFIVRAVNEFGVSDWSSK